MRQARMVRRRSCPNHAGGVLGAYRPAADHRALRGEATSSILTPRRTIDNKGARPRSSPRPPRSMRRHKAVPVGEAMMACVLADQFLRHRGQWGEVFAPRSAGPCAAAPLSARRARPKRFSSRRHRRLFTTPAPAAGSPGADRGDRRSAGGRAFWRAAPRRGAARAERSAAPRA